MAAGKQKNTPVIVMKKKHPRLSGIKTGQQKQK
ncbi:hypothetical protein SEEN176_12639 [Salmonella enterica subsp. enterica serovar Newport str. CVM 4176]|nr:hypothetical protein SEEN176_12639 [Salmonella enterica subsp. enterica serovar Newport str. CVM 4176]